jgi:sulfoxide reductase heme-binding subunit YedZ
MSISKDNLKTIFKAIIFANILVLFSLTTLFYVEMVTIQMLFTIGKYSGILAVIVFLLSQVSGILRRFQATNELKNIGDYLMFSRAQIGILMYILAFTHYFFVALFPVVIVSGQLPVIQAFTAAGMVAFLLSLPLAITSNNQSKKLLKKWWKRLHKLVYVIIWFIAIHVGLIAISYGFSDLSSAVVSVLVVGVGVIQIYSLIYANRVKNKKATN